VETIPSDELVAAGKLVGVDGADVDVVDVDVVDVDVVDVDDVDVDVVSEEVGRPLIRAC